MITLLASYPSIDALIVAFRDAGGTINPSEGAIAAEAMVNCAGTPPTFFDGWTYDPSLQLPNLYKGMVDVREIAAVQTSSQESGWRVRLSAVETGMNYMEFVGAHAAEWYCRPENLAAFLEICPSGCLVFLEKYRCSDRSLAVVCLFVRGGRMHVSNCCAGSDDTFDGKVYFAIRRKLSA